MAIFTTKQKYDLDNSMVAAQNVSLGTLLSEIQYGSLTEEPTVGTIETMAVLSYSVAPAIGTATATKAAYTLGATGATGITAGITQPDVPRALSIKGNASGISGNVKIYGTDIQNTIVTDTIALNAATEVDGVVAFKTVTAIDFPAKTNGSGDTVSIGRADIIGLPIATPNASTVIAKSFNGAVDTGTVVADATVGKSTFAPAGTLDGAKIVKVVFVA